MIGNPVSRHGPLVGAHDTARLHAGSHVSSHDRPIGRAAAHTTAPVHSRPGAGHAVDGLCRDREFSVTTRVIRFHVATWSTVSRHGSSATRAFGVAT